MVWRRRHRGREGEARVQGQEEKAKAALLIIAAHVKENFPMLRGCADSILGITELSLEKDGIVIKKFEVN